MEIIIAILLICLVAYPIYRSFNKRKDSKGVAINNPSVGAGKGKRPDKLKNDK